MTNSMVQTVCVHVDSALKLTYLLENLKEPRHVFRELPAFHLIDVRNHSIATNIVKAALTTEQDNAIMRSIEDIVTDTFIQKLTEKGVDTSLFTISRNMPHTHWSSFSFTIAYAGIKLVAYSPYNGATHDLDLDFDLERIEGNISKFTAELERIADKDTAHFLGKKARLNDLLQSHTDRRDTFLTNKTTALSVREKLKEIFIELR